MAAHHNTATATIAELHDLLVCDICAEPYDNGIHRAKFLECYHTFCAQCLVLLAGKVQDNSNNILCPNCRRPTHLSDAGVDTLQANFYIEKMKVATEQATTNLITEGCFKHYNQPLVFFCKTCRTAICRDCTVLDHDKTAGHSIVNFSDAVNFEREELQDRLTASRLTRTQVKDVVRQIESDMEQLHVCRDTTMKDLRSVMQSAHQELDQYEQEVSRMILQQHETEQRTLLDNQLKCFQTSALLDKYIGHSEELLKTCQINEMTYIAGKLNKTAEIAKSDFALLRTRAECLTSDMITSGTSVNERLCHLGHECLKSIFPTKVDFTSSKIRAGFLSELIIKPSNYENIKVPIATCLLSVKICDPRGNVLPVTLNATDPDLTVTFTPQMSGNHDISVIYLGRPLKGKQTHISVESNNPVLKIGGPGDGSGTFDSPRDIAIDNKGCLYVADTGNGLIQKFSADGDFLSQFRVNEYNKDYAAFTLGLDWKRDLLICTEISVENNAAVEESNILLFNLEGERQNSYTVNISCPWYVAMNARGNALISDQKDKCVLEMDREGHSLCRMGDLKNPGFICTDKDGIIIVSDSVSHAVFVINPDGTNRHTFGSFGMEIGQLAHPFGVATDGANILVAEGHNNRVQVFRYDGTPVCVIESNKDPLDKPRGLAVTGDGHVYVVDRDNHCIKKYKYKD